MKRAGEASWREAPRRALTVGDLKRFLAALPDDMPLASVYQPDHDWGPYPPRRADPLTSLPAVLDAYDTANGRCVMDGEWGRGFPIVKVLAL